MKTIIFDAGGVIFESGWDKVKRDIMKRYNFSIFLYSDYPKKIQSKFEGLNLGKISFKKVIKELSGRKNKKEASKIIEDYKKSYKKHQKINKRILNLIKKLKKSYKLFCLTDTNDLHFQINTKNKLFSDFRKIYASCKIKIKKPDKRAFKLILKENKIKPEEVIFIDNNLGNIKSARKLGIKTILFKNHYQLVKDLRKMGVKA